jgi:myo-inositol catabolism protein IolS
MMVDTFNTTRVALGTWAWGDSGEAGAGYFGSAFTQADIERLVEKARAAGFTLWDTAVVYGMGRAETALGNALQRYPRSDFQLSTKFTPQAAGTGEHPMAEMLEGSLARLRTDYIDLYWIHNPADVARWTPQLVPLLESGKIKHVGVSNHNLREIQLADEILSESGFRVEAVQSHYSLLYRSAEGAGIIDYCRKRGLPFFAYMVLEQGALSGKYGPHNPLPQNTNRAQAYNGLLHHLTALTERLTSIGEKHSAAISDVATAWALAKGTTPIVGVTKPSYIDGIVRAINMQLSGDEIAELEALADASNVNTRGWWEKDML